MKKIASSPSLLIEVESEGSLIKKTSLSLTEGGFFFKGPSLFEEWLYAYANKKPLPFPVTLSFKGLSPFTQKVLRELMTIKFGHLISYSALAEKIDHPRAYRAVGTACGNNPFPFLIPCHRVIAKDLSIGGFTSGLDIKKELISFEK